MSLQLHHLSPCFPLGLAHFRWYFCLISWKWDEAFVIYYVIHDSDCRKVHISNPFFSKLRILSKSKAKCLIIACQPWAFLHMMIIKWTIWNLLQHHILHLLPFLLPWFHALITHASLFIFSYSLAIFLSLSSILRD